MPAARAWPTGVSGGVLFGAPEGQSCSGHIAHEKPSAWTGLNPGGYAAGVCRELLTVRHILRSENLAHSRPLPIRRLYFHQDAGSYAGRGRRSPRETRETGDVLDRRSMRGLRRWVRGRNMADVVAVHSESHHDSEETVRHHLEIRRTELL